MSAGMAAFRRAQQPTLSKNKAIEIANAEFERLKEEIEHKSYVEGAFQALLVSMEVLHDQHGFGKVRLQQFLDRFNFKMHCVGEARVTLDEMTEGLKAIGVNPEALPSLNLKEVPDVQQKAI